MSNIVKLGWLLWFGFSAYSLWLLLVIGGEATIASWFLALLISAPISLLITVVFVALTNLFLWFGNRANCHIG
jgi:hypothetical protein